MLVSFSAEGPRSVGLLASGANGSLRIKRILDTEWLPLYHANSERLVDVLSIRIRARIVQSYANIRRSPRRSFVVVANSAHISSLKILFALLANR